MRILLVMLEFPLWLKARHWSYTGNFAIRNAMQAHGIETLVLPAFQGIKGSNRQQWLDSTQELLDDQKFDQVWLWTVHYDYDDDFLNYIKSIAPIRVGWLGENLFYTPEEYNMSPELHARKTAFLQQAKALTHVIVAADELEVKYVENEIGLPAIWWPTAVPLENVVRHCNDAYFNNAVFCGSPYGRRKAFLQNEAVNRVLVSISPPENAFSLPERFNDLCKNNIETLSTGEQNDLKSLQAFTDELGKVRREIFTIFQKGLARYALIVNLPSYGKCYTSRVVEAMGGGRPVLAWRVPGRARNEELFTENQDIFLYNGDDAEEFADKINKLLLDKSLLNSVAENARRKVLSYHTTEIRVRQVLDWISTGQQPAYSDKELSCRTQVSVDTFYTELFTHNSEWSGAEPNDDERIRWEGVETHLKQIIPNIHYRPRILEVGCGRGWLCKRLSHYGDYIGIDPVSNVINHAQELFKEHEFRVGRIQDLPPEEAFDIIIATEVLEHVELNGQAEFVRDLFKHTRSGGSIIITTPRAELFQSWLKIVEPQPAEFWFDECSLQKLFSLKGFLANGMLRLYKAMPKVFAVDPLKQYFIAPDQVPLYQAWLFTKSEV